MRIIALYRRFEPHQLSSAPRGYPVEFSPQQGGFKAISGGVFRGLGDVGFLRKINKLQKFDLCQPLAESTADNLQRFAV